MSTPTSTPPALDLRGRSFGRRWLSPCTKARDGHARAAGFTLIELLTSIAILLILVGMLTAAFNTASNTWRAAEKDVERFQDARAALDLIARDLQQVIVNSNIPFFASATNMAFVATVNDDPAAVDLAEVVYWLDTNNFPYTLTRRFTKSTSPQWDFYQDPLNWPVTADSTIVVCSSNVVSFSLVCYYTNGTPVSSTPAGSFWNSLPKPNVWGEPPGKYVVPSAGLNEMMTNMPPAFVDVHLAVVDSKTAKLLKSLAGTPAALANLTNQATRTFAVFVKIPQR
jgi:prepilin-type N-terminal cleavage/methylation domain-containing protein